MKRRPATAAALALAAGALLAVAVARADDPPTAASYRVGAYSCIVLNSGHATVPAGSTIVVRGGWASGTSGAVQSFLAAQTTIVSVNDGWMQDVSGGYGAPAPGSVGWVSFVDVPTSVTLASPGDTMRFTFTMILNRRVADIYDYDGDGSIDPGPLGPGITFGGTCTVTAA